MRDLLKFSVPALAASLLLAACGSSSSKTTGSTSTQGAAQTTAASSATVTSASSSLGTILVDAHGMTLYSLSAERGGKFICTTSACTGIWHPLTVASGATPSGTVSSLGTIKRPDGTTQVTYSGAPLYTFAQDSQAGQTGGQGVKDVGTWSVIKIGSATPSTTTQTTETSKSGGGYAY